MSMAKKTELVEQKKIDETDIYNVFIRWYVLDDQEKWEKTGVLTTAEFSQKLNIEESKLAEFTKRPTFSKDIALESLNQNTLRLPKVINKIYNQVYNSQTVRVSDVKNYMEIIGMLKDLTTDKEKGGGVNLNILNISDERFNNIANRQRSVSSGELPFLVNPK
jgi:hypothetical protein